MWIQRGATAAISANNPLHRDSRIQSSQQPPGQMGKPRHREAKFLVPAGHWQSWGISWVWVPTPYTLGLSYVLGDPGRARTSPHLPVTVITLRHLETVRGRGGSAQRSGRPCPLLPLLLRRGGLWPSPEAFSPHARCGVEDGLVPRWPWSEPISVYIRLINNSGWQLSREEVNPGAHSQGRLRPEPA